MTLDCAGNGRAFLRPAVEAGEGFTRSARSRSGSWMSRALDARGDLGLGTGQMPGIGVVSASTASAARPAPTGSVRRSPPGSAFSASMIKPSTPIQAR